MRKQTGNRNAGIVRKAKRIKQSTVVRTLNVLAMVSVALVFVMLSWNMRASNEYDVVWARQKDMLTNIQLFENTSEYLTREARAYVATSAPSHYKNYLDEINKNKTREKALDALRGWGITPEEEALIQAAMDSSQSLVPLEIKAVELAQNGNNMDAVNTLYNRDYETGAQAIKDNMQQLEDTVGQRTQAELNDLGRLIDFTFALTFVSLALVMVVQIAMMSYVKRDIINPMLSVRDNMDQMARGDIGAELSVPVDGTEIGQLATAMINTKRRTSIIIQDISQVLGEMASGNFVVDTQHEDNYVGAYQPILESMRVLREKQSDTLLQIDQVADEVRNDSHQVAAGAQATAQGATEQAASVEQLSSVIKDIAAKTAENGQSVVQANALAQQAGVEVAEGNEKMREMISAMNEINESSSQIANIIKTIDDIAFQINILSLNAAVEAARAGAAGKGFAVVAGEVKNLANKSAAAAADTTTLISNSLEVVKKGTVIANETAEKLETMVTHTNNIITVIDEIRKASDEQTEASNQVAEGIAQIAAVVQTSSATAEESAAASKEMSDQADTLKQLVNQFTLTV